MGAAVKNRYRLLIINSDGTPAGFSGNGTRIFAKYLMDTETATVGQSLEIEIPSEEASDALTWIVPAVPSGPVIGTSKTGISKSPPAVADRDSSGY